MMRWVQSRQQKLAIHDWVVHDSKLIPVSSFGPSIAFVLEYDLALDLAILRERIDQHLGQPLTVKVDGETEALWLNGDKRERVVPAAGEYPVLAADEHTVTFTPPGSWHRYVAWRAEVREFHWDKDEEALIHAKEKT